MTARDLVFIGDVHLDRDDPDLTAFLAFLEALVPTTERIVLMGDLFNLWIGSEELEQPHHRAVIDQLASMRRRGLVVRYLEGNRDYRVGARHAGGALEDASEEGFEERHAGRRLWCAHGDLVNVRDRQYRTWRRVSRSRAAWAVFSLVPRRRRLAFAESLERRMRGTNLGMKRAVPEELLRAYAAPRFAAGFDAVVLGHFHVELDVRDEGKRILVVPEWKGSRRHLRVGADGTIAFVGGGGG
ncbi:MAG TPA: metallophosphoesterase [Candidatus Polarisedimenticolaceae bacterium]